MKKILALVLIILLGNWLILSLGNVSAQPVFSHSPDNYTRIESITPAQSVYNYTHILKSPLNHEISFKPGPISLTEGLDPSLYMKMKSVSISGGTIENILIQFIHDPKSDETNILKDLGFKEVEYMSNNAFFASVPIT